MVSKDSSNNASFVALCRPNACNQLADLNLRIQLQKTRNSFEKQLEPEIDLAANSTVQVMESSEGGRMEQIDESATLITKTNVISEHMFMILNKFSKNLFCQCINQSSEKSQLL